MNRPDVNDDALRRRCLLLSLYMAEGSMAQLLDLLRDLRLTHGLLLSADRARGDLTWLQEQGLVRVRDDVAQITERGRDVAVGSAPWPGR